MSEKTIAEIQETLKYRHTSSIYDAVFKDEVEKWLRFLLSELDKMEEENRKLREELDELRQDFGALEYANIDDLKELEQLRGENQTLKKSISKLEDYIVRERKAWLKLTHTDTYRG